LPGIGLATLHALLKIQFIFLESLEQSRRNTRRNSAFHRPAVEKRDARISTELSLKAITFFEDGDLPRLASTVRKRLWRRQLR
jgi:hypothetical protein